MSIQSHKGVPLGKPLSRKKYKCLSPSLYCYLVFPNVTIFPHLLSEFIITDNIYVFPLGQLSDSISMLALLSPPFVFDLPTTFREGTHSTHNISCNYVTLSYHRLSPSLYTCLSCIFSISIPKIVGDALTHPGWRKIVLDELYALQNRGTWNLVPLPPRKFVFGYQQAIIVKVGSDDTINQVKAHLVAKSYTQIFGLDYGDTAPITKKIFVILLLAMATLQQLSLYHLEVKNVFLHDDLLEEMYMKQPPSIVF